MKFVITLSEKAEPKLYEIFVCSIFILLSRESDGTLYFERIHTRLGVVPFRVPVVV